MSIFNILPLEDYEDKAPSVDSQELPYAEESRGTFGDLMSGLFRGTASTTALMGKGLQQSGFEDIGSSVRSAGESMLKSEWAKPDEYEYLGLDDSRTKQIAMGVAENLPFVLGTIGTTLAGSAVAGPVGGFAAGGSFLGLTAGAGTYKATMEELDLKRPDLSRADKERVALTESAIEFGTEGIGALISGGAGKLFGGSLTKPVIKAGLRSMIEGGEISATQLLATTIGKGSVKDLAKALTVAGLGEGSSEVAAQVFSEANREAAGLDNDPSDLFNVFASAAILGGGMGGVGYAHSAKQIKSMRESINYGLSSQDPTIRAATVDALSKRLTALDPEAGNAFVQTIGNAAIAGPVDLEAAFKIQTEYPGGPILPAWQANLKNLETQGLINQITSDPAPILEEAGIPTGVAPVTFSTNPYGTAEFAKEEFTPVSKPSTVPADLTTPQVIQPKPETPLWKSDRPSYVQPFSPYDMSKALQEVEPGTNQAMGEQGLPKTLQQIEAEKEAVREKVRQANQPKNPPGVAQYQQPRGPYAMAKAMEEVDPLSNTVLSPEQLRIRELTSKEKRTIKEQQELKKLLKKFEAPDTAKAAPVPVESKPVETKTTPTQSQEADKKARIVELSEALRDETIPEKLKVQYSQELEALTEQSGQPTLLGETEGWEKKELNGKTVYVNKDTAIVKKNNRSWDVWQQKPGTDRVNLGVFTSFKEAKEAAIKGPQEAPVKEKKVTPLTPKQIEVLKGADIQKVAEMVVSSVPEVRGDPEAIGVATEAILESAAKFDPAKGARFSTFAYKSARGKVLSYYKKRSEIQSMEKSSTAINRGEGSEGTTKIESATKQDVQEAIPLKEVKTKAQKEATPPVTKPELSEEEKAKVLERVKQKTLAQKQKEKAEKLTKITAKEEVKAEEVQEEPSEAPTTIIRIKDTTLLPTPKEAKEINPKPSTKAQEILTRAKFNKDQARKIAQAIRDPKEREATLAHIESATQFTVKDFLDKTINSYPSDSQVSNLAVFLKRVAGKKLQTNVVVDPSLEVEYFDSKSGTVFLRNTNPNKITLHEIVHALTARELQVSPELRGRVREIMNVVEARVLADPKIAINEKLIKRMRRAGATSSSFRQEFAATDLQGDGGILYALLNEKEFLAQAMNDSRFQELLQKIEVPSMKRTVWDYVVDFFSQIFGTSKIQNNALKEVLQLTAELAEVDLSQVRVKPTQDQIFVGQLAKNLDLKGLVGAKARLSEGMSKSQIRQETGWFQGVDGLWRYEIDDSKMRIVFPSQLTEETLMPLRQLVEHKELFESYPYLNQLVVEIRDIPKVNGKRAAGYYDPINKIITLQKGVSPKRAKGILLHELQHFVQYAEGFATGSSPQAVDVLSHLDKMKGFYNYIQDNLSKEEALNGVTPELEQMKADVAYMQRLLNVVESQSSFVKELKKEADKIDSEITKKLRKGDSQISDIEDLYDTLRSIDQRISDNLPEIPDSLKYDLYRMVAGEVEARNVESRAEFSSDKRNLLDPEETQSVNNNYQIFENAQNAAASIDMAPPAETQAPKTWKDRADVLARNDVRPDRFTIFRNYMTTRVPEFVKDVAKSSTERLRKIEPRLLEHVRRFEFAINKYNVKYHDEVRGFIKKYEKMDRADQRMLDLVLLNDYPEDVEKRWEILKKYKMEQDYQRVVGIIKDIYRRKQQVALGKFKETPDYFPRSVKDLLGLVQAVRKDPNYGVISAELDAAGLNEADKEAAIQDLVNTGRFPALALLRPGADKNRSIKRVSSEWAHYYKSSVESLTSFIYESNEAIEARRMFGDVARKKLVQERTELERKLESADKMDQRKKIVAKIQLIENQLDNYEEDWHSGIAELLAREGHILPYNEQMEVVSLIRARLLQKGMTGLPAFIRNMSLLTVLNGPGSAITQLTDFAVAAHENGLKNFGVSLFGKKKITTKDLDLSHSMREFQTEGSARFLDRVLRLSGLKFMDTFGKNTFMNAAIEKAKNQSLEKFTKQWEAQLGADTEATWREIQSNKVTDLTRFFAFNALSEWQPISLSEMPKKYLEAGNGRIFYALKSYNIKMLNNFYRTLVYRTREASTMKERAAAIKDAGKLLIVLTLAGAAADELKDFIFGREVDFSDNVLNNLLKIFFLNTYMLEQGDKKGMVKTIFTDTLLPPTRFADDAYQDIRNLFDEDKAATAKFIKGLPWGTLVYAHFTDDAEKTRYKNLKEKVSTKIKEGESFSNFRSEIREYNQWAKKNNEPLMTSVSLRNMRKRAQKKERNR